MNIWQSIKILFNTLMAGFKLGEKVTDKKIAEIPMREKEHEENKPIRLIELEVGKLDSTGDLLRRYKRLEKQADRLDVDFNKLANELGLVHIEHIELYDKGLESEEKEFLEEIPNNLKSGVKKQFKEKRKQRKEKRKKFKNAKS